MTKIEEKPNVKKILVLVNKNWETEGVVAALVNVGLKPAVLPFPSKINIPKYNESTLNPRLVMHFNKINDDKTDSGEEIMEVSVFCIQDIMYYGMPKTKEQSGSSSEEKYNRLPALIASCYPDLVLSVSTAGYPTADNYNGSVVIGPNFFLYNGNDDNPSSRFVHKDFEKLLTSSVNDEFFDIINNDFRNKVEPKFLKMPRNTYDHPCCIASKVFTALSTVNITDYAEYNWADHKALAKYEEVVGAMPKKFPCRSSETTHGIVKVVCNEYNNAPVVFITPVTDQFGQFDFDVTPTQNFAASFNSGIVLAQLLCELRQYVQDGKKFTR